MLTGLWLLCFLLMISFLSVISIQWDVYHNVAPTKPSLGGFIPTISIRLQAVYLLVDVTFGPFIYFCIAIYVMLLLLLLLLLLIFRLFAWIQTNLFVVDCVSMCIGCISCICVHICRLTVQVIWIDRQISYCIPFQCGHCNFYECSKTWSQIIHWR